jgi:hypothetical protein
MRGIRYMLAAVAAAAVIALPATVNKAEAQISVGIGVAPNCPYGYYGYAPYNCAPYGYYGPEWFNGGVFLGAGPWFHGPAHFYGGVNRAFDPRFGYHGGFPAHGAYHEPADHWGGFHGSHMADPHGGFHGAYHGGGHR